MWSDVVYGSKCIVRSAASDIILTRSLSKSNRVSYFHYMWDPLPSDGSIACQTPSVQTTIGFVQGGMAYVLILIPPSLPSHIITLILPRVQYDCRLFPDHTLGGPGMAIHDPSYRQRAIRWQQLLSGQAPEHAEADSRSSDVADCYPKWTIVTIRDCFDCEDIRKLMIIKDPFF